MSITTTPDTTTTATEQDTAAPEAQPTTATVEHIDPHQVQFEDNVRETVDLDKGFLASIKSEGVLLPVLARRDLDGTIYVRDGQRRTLAARQAGLATIPAYFGTVSETKSARIVQQLVTNDRRTAISDGEWVAAFHQLALEGMTSTAIARKTGERKATVEASITVAQNPYARAAIATGQITLDAALILAEFEDDPDVVAYLTEIAIESPDGLPHAAQRARDDRERKEKITAAVAVQETAGIRAVTNDAENTGTPLTRLTDDKDTRSAVDAESHTGCPGHAILIESRWGGGLTETPVCLDPEANGHKPRHAGQSYSSGPRTGPMSEAEKAERRLVIENNKAWDAAETVRIGWLTTFLSRRTLPKDAAQFVARGLTAHRRVVGAALSDGNSVAATILGVTSDGRWGQDRIGQYIENHPTKAQHATLAVILGGIEGSTSRNTWRRTDRDAAAYLTRLAGWGYTLSTVEQGVIDAVTEADNPRQAAEDAPAADTAPDTTPEVEPEADDFDPFTDHHHEADAPKADDSGTTD